MLQFFDIAIRVMLQHVYYVICVMLQHFDYAMRIMFQYFDYVIRVMFPEILIKVYMDVSGASHEQTEVEMWKPNRARTQQMLRENGGKL